VARFTVANEQPVIEMLKGAYRCDPETLQRVLAQLEATNADT
jgi:hypothetical protein